MFVGETPKVFHHPAQGWREERTPTLGKAAQRGNNSERVASGELGGMQPFQGGFVFYRGPGVARGAQPRADRLNAVGVPGFATVAGAARDVWTGDQPIED